MIHSFLLIGQSNAAGRGFYEEAPALDTCNKRIKVLRNGRWQTAFRPINPDRSFSGVCFAESFAAAYAAAHPDVEVGIIPCADGGTHIEQWLPGSLLFDHAVACAKLAMRTSRLVGILWHQGEGDCAPALYPVYGSRLRLVMDTLRETLEMPTLPILVGGLGDFLAERTETPSLQNYPHINQQLMRFAEECPHSAFVSAVGLGSNPDLLHFSSAALYEFGRRYYEAFAPFVPRDDADSRPLQDDSARSAMEEL